MELAGVSDFVKNRSELQDNVSEFAVGAFIYLSANNGAYSKHNSQTNNNGLQGHAHYLADELNIALIETGESNFTFCGKWDDCSGLKDPVTSVAIDSLEKDRKSSKYNHVNWEDYFARHPFPPGKYLVENYFSVPDSAKNDLCKRAGYNSSCFSVPTYDNQNQYIPPIPCNEKELKSPYTSCDLIFSQKAPFRYAFLMANGGMSHFDQINAFLRQFKEDPVFKRRWEDAIAKDVFLKLSTSKTRKVEKDWIMTRIEFNPTLFCQYARPNSELFSQ